MVVRGLLLLGMMLVIVAMVCLVLFRAQESRPPLERTSHAESDALAVVNVAAGFPDQFNWGALFRLSESLPSSPGWPVRYNAVIALARRGSAEVPLDVLAQMLDENQQRRNFRVRLEDGMFTVDEYAAHSTVLSALKALDDWQKHKDAVQAVGAADPQLQRVYAAVDKLTSSKNDAVRQEAERVKKVVSG